MACGRDRTGFHFASRAGWRKNELRPEALHARSVDSEEDTCGRSGFRPKIDTVEKARLDHPLSLERTHVDPPGSPSRAYRQEVPGKDEKG
jgi:hypothetical protein